MLVNILYGLTLVFFLVFAITLIVDLSYSSHKERSSMFLKHRWIPFRKRIYKFKISHQCVLCNKFDLTKHMLFIPLTNRDNIITNSSTIGRYFHEKCVKIVLENPEKYNNEILSSAIYIPEYLKHMMESYEALKQSKEKERNTILEKAKQVNLSLFLDEVTGKLTFEKEKYR
jgi:hypothetical protein